MFSQSTVLVLGAGASFPYGFPLGKQLKESITDFTVNTNIAECKQMQELGHSEPEILEFHTSLARSDNETIDAFLEDRPSLRRIGTFAIAQVLMRAETEENLYIPPRRDWYPILYRELDLKHPDITPLVSGIVTFNYDRSLEHYLTETTNRTFEGKKRDAALTKLSHIPIIHVHGSFGPYPDVPYKAQHTTDEIKRGADSISLIQDANLDEANEFHQARVLISNASEVIFLGFGYDPRNLRRLGPDLVKGHSLLFGTAVDLPSEREEEVKATLRGRIQLDRSHTIVNYLKGFDNARASVKLTLA